MVLKGLLASLAVLGMGVTAFPEQLLDPCAAWNPSFAVPSGGPFNPPKKIRHVVPRLPAEVSSTTWLGAVVVNEKGGITEVHRVRPVNSDSAVDAAVQKAIRGWRYEPYMVNGTATPICLAVKVQIHAR